MDHIGIDVHKKDSQICILAEGGAEGGAPKSRSAPASPGSNGACA